MTQPTNRPYRATKNAETPLGSLTEGQTVYIDPSDARVAPMLEGGFLEEMEQTPQEADQARLAEEQAAQREADNEDADKATRDSTSRKR